MKIYKLLFGILSICFITSCDFEAFLNIETLEWSVSGTIETGTDPDSDTKIAAFYRNGSGEDNDPGTFTSSPSIVSNIVSVEENAEYTLNISAPAFDTFEDHQNYIDVLFWIDSNANDELDDSEYYAPAISSNPDAAVFPFWISFYSYGERDSSIGTVNWEAYSKKLMPVSYLDMSNTNVKPYDWFEYNS